MARPRIDIDPDTKEEVEQYAEDNGLRMPRAYAELIEEGLNSSKAEA